MTYRENVKLALHSIRSNKLRTFLTALIIAIGLTALVGILTSIDAIKGALTNTFTSMGANSFTIRNRGTGIRIGGSGKRPKRYTSITYEQARDFKQLFTFPDAQVSVNVFASFAGSVKYGNTKTNPNISILGADDVYMYTSGYKLAEGRNFSKSELEYGSNVVIIGNEIKTKLFPKTSPIDKIITLGSDKFRVIGLFEEKGSSMGFGGDKVCVIPIEKANEIMTNSNPSYTIAVISGDAQASDVAAGEATALFRNIRRLSASKDNNFEISKSDAVSQTLIENLWVIQLGAMLIAFVTLVGASIGLMNIMLVSVTERTREIGIRKAIGATPQVIRRQFLMEAIVICLLGGSMGIIIGILMGNTVSLLMGSSFIIPWGWMALGTFLCVLVGLISGFYPASKASKLDPIESLRFE